MRVRRSSRTRWIAPLKVQISANRSYFLSTVRAIISGRTTLVIAHRLSTIRHADKIVVMHKGEVVEEGDHDSLMDLGGTYHNLVEQQNLRRAEEEEQMAFERRESTNMVVAHQNDENRLTLSDGMRLRSSTVISLTPSAIATLYGNKNNTTGDDEDREKTKKKVKVDDDEMEIHSDNFSFDCTGKETECSVANLENESTRVGVHCDRLCRLYHQRRHSTGVRHRSE